MGCELCGKEAVLFKTEIEGSVLNVCEGCSKFGTVISKIKTEQEVKKEEKRMIVHEAKEEAVETIVEGYALLIKNAREKMNLKQEEFAKKINEKVSVVQHLENASITPSIALARKLERFLGIRLVELEEYEFTPGKKESGEVMTIGDVIKVKSK